jgi:hypothetical protein
MYHSRLWGVSQVDRDRLPRRRGQARVGDRRREDPEPYIAARQHAEVGAADQDDKPPKWAETAAAPEGSPLEDEAGLPGNASSIQRFSPKYGGAVLKRSRTDLRHKFCKVTLIVTLIYQI